MLFTIPNSKDSDWTTFESVQPLFALELPWQVPQADGIEAIKVDTFIQCFSADMKIAPSLLPKHGLSRNDFQAFSETLLELLGFLESLVRVNVLEPTRQEVFAHCFRDSALADIGVRMKINQLRFQIPTQGHPSTYKARYWTGYRPQCLISILR
jgi:hypothetical protein